MYGRKNESVATIDHPIILSAFDFKTSIWLPILVNRRKTRFFSVSADRFIKIDKKNRVQQNWNVTKTRHSRIPKQHTNVDTYYANVWHDFCHWFNFIKTNWHWIHLESHTNAKHSKSEWCWTILFFSNVFWVCLHLVSV